jgi:hypothetical protein
MPGSIGRMMAADDNYLYLVTTVAVIMRYHTIEYATNALCNFVLDPGDSTDRVNPPYDVRKTRVKPVLNKIVNSIALNVVNSGHCLKDLPNELKNLCSHETEYLVFAATIASIQARA